MIDLSENIKTKWSTRNKNYYVEKGYDYSGIGDELWVRVGDLPQNSSISVHVKCDCEDCSSPDAFTPLRNYNRIVKENGIYRCKSCTIKNNHLQSLVKAQTREKYYQLFLDKCAEHDCIPLTTFDEFINTTIDVRYICPIHGETKTNMSRIIWNDAWCYDCGKIHMREKERFSPEEVKEIIESRNNNKLLNKNDYVNIKTSNLMIICGSCNNVFTTSLGSFIAGNGKCAACYQQYSRGENKIAEVLNKYNVKHIRQMKFDDCRDKNVLPFDFYLPEHNCLIEFQGKQHYESVEYFGGQEYLEYVQKHDKIKKEYANNNNIDIFYIDYLQKNDIEEILVTKFNLE